MYHNGTRGKSNYVRLAKLLAAEPMLVNRLIAKEYDVAWVMLSNAQYQAALVKILKRHPEVALRLARRNDCPCTVRVKLPPSANLNGQEIVNNAFRPHPTLA